MSSDVVNEVEALIKGALYSSKENAKKSFNDSWNEIEGTFSEVTIPEHLKALCKDYYYMGAIGVMALIMPTVIHSASYLSKDVREKLDAIRNDLNAYIRIKYSSPEGE